MPQPVVVILSRDPQLTGDLPGWLQGRAEVRACDSLEELADLARWVEPQGIVADFRRSGSSGVEQKTLDVLQTRWPQATVAVLMPDQGPANLEQRASLQNLPVVKGRVDRQTLLHALSRLLVEPTSSSDDEPPTPSTPPVDDTPLASLTGISRRYETNSPQLKQVLADLEVAARHDVTILLIGETGAGKTYLSRLIHEVSPRRHEPFLPVACGALPADLIESELFGHMKGSFTSAHQDKEGKFLAARRGSILLDEIDVLGLEQQVKLLRVIETGEFEPVGSNQTQLSRARLIAASNLDLQPLVEQGRFRPDLYYRLNMLKFVIPPLRQRKMDIVPLARKFMSQFALKHGVKIEHVDQNYLQALLNYPWPGNVRELEHVVQRSVIYCRDGALTAQQLPHHILSGTAGPTNDPTVVLPGMTQPVAAMIIDDRSLGGQMSLTEKEIIEQTLFKNSFSRTKTAKELGISRVTLYNKMKKYGLLS
ncbi:MAG TPA: sigma-54 dependent transcriptional regulator [Planctomycetaceae bacterium]|nr:sigma-54 dependent transcriptional regulator [Planctomycetaceae bacterium]